MPDNYDVVDGRDKENLLRMLRKPVRKHRKPTIDVIRAKGTLRPEYDRDYKSDEGHETD